jgi:hypothetical protein
MKRLPFLAASVALCFAAPAFAAPADSVSRIVTSQAYKTAAAALDSGHDQWVKDIVAITQIAAPPFKEDARARAFAEMLRERGLDPSIDEAGNVLALRKGTEAGRWWPSPLTSTRFSPRGPASPSSARATS